MSCNFGESCAFGLPLPPTHAHHEDFGKNLPTTLKGTCVIMLDARCCTATSGTHIKTPAVVPQPFCPKSQMQAQHAPNGSSQTRSSPGPGQDVPIVCPQHGHTITRQQPSGRPWPWGLAGRPPPQLRDPSQRAPKSPAQVTSVCVEIQHSKTPEAWHIPTCQPGSAEQAPVRDSLQSGTGVSLRSVARPAPWAAAPAR